MSAQMIFDTAPLGAISRKLTRQELAILAVRAKTTSDETTAKAGAQASLWS